MTFLQNNGTAKASVNATGLANKIFNRFSELEYELIPLVWLILVTK
jgi:hypothetical protein